jgi:phospholipid transport system substrate-binding protein
MKLRHIAILTLLILIVPLTTYAADPTATVKAYVDEVLNVLNDSASEDSKKEEIRKIAARMFDFSAMSKATLGKNWKKLDKDQRPEFVRLLRSILENAYISKMLGYTDEKTVFIKERPLSKTRVEVQTNLVTGSMEIPMHYRMLRLKNQWKVYDVIIEGVSLIKNYRTQFRRILAKQSPDELLQVMRKKVGKI